MNNTSGISVEKAMQIKAEHRGLRITNMQKVRVERNMSQKELAEKSGVNIYTIRRYEGFPETIDSGNLNTLCDLCLALGCKLDDVLENKRLIEKLKRVI